ncbi:MAG TPA: hypothetical protein VMC09_13080 [Anaerolineales bacterium]|nr:hypothetical protein [Anaerolineales bacterium]HVN66799.1 hypothetical protein [Candidatus Sulfotelmatobacter sp.]
MNVESKYDAGQGEAPEPKKKYMFLGYGGYNSRGGGQLEVGAISRSPHFFDAVFEALGLKKKIRRCSEGEE